MARPERTINPDLEKAIKGLLKEVMAANYEGTLTDKMKVIDRALNLEKIRMKISEDSWGSGFEDKDDDEDK